MIFEILAERNADDRKTFYYDNETNVLSDSTGFVYEYPEKPASRDYTRVPFSKDRPLHKNRRINLLKIQLGLSCNYTCDYCSQRFVERPPETNRKDIEEFLRKLDNLDFNEQEGLKIEFWGGEPLVYWKTLKPLAEALRDRFSGWEQEPVFSIITNGSILTREMCAWLYYMRFNVAISHDGPGQHVRGPDPFDDPKQKKIILDFYNTMRKQNRISFNAMMNGTNRSRKEVNDWFIELTGDPDVPLGEGGIVDAYDDGGVDNSLATLADHFDYRKRAFNDIFTTNGKLGFKNIVDKVDEFTRSVLSHKNSIYLGQKCGMDNSNVMAVDLRGNVLTCQNVSAEEMGMNGTPHLAGNITDMDAVRVTAATHWRNRPACQTCPVLHICKGSCMFLNDKYWDVSCDNAYSDNVPLFALSIEKITGYIPVTVKGEGLPKEREDIWGQVFEHQDRPRAKAFPVRVVVEKVGKIDEVEVYGKSRVETA
jgi:uncharacterized protein